MTGNRCCYCSTANRAGTVEAAAAAAADGRRSSATLCRAATVAGGCGTGDGPVRPVPAASCGPVWQKRDRQCRPPVYTGGFVSQI